MIFSNSHKNGSSLHDGIEEVLEGLNNCSSITKRVAEKSPSPNFQEGSVCLSAMRHEIEKINSELTSKQTLSR